MISILHPSRNRPNKSAETLEKWISRAAHPQQLEIIISIDSDDVFSDLYMAFANSINANTLISPNRSAVDAINNAAKIARGDIFIVVSDDTDCPEHWDKKIIKVVEGKTDWLLKVPDGGTQNWIITMPIMDRAFYNRFGYVYYPDYLHMFCDTDLTAVGDITGRTIHADVSFNHQHYSKTQAAKDAVSEKADSTWDQGKKLFLSRAKNNFGIENPVGKITDPVYLAWLQKEMN